jgi:hypothetical protein
VGADYFIGDKTFLGFGGALNWLFFIDGEKYRKI